ncbi:unnamed protein product [Effrenium voratum]|uniref:Uncharacterized protein n=1 Tax=Effrenium voratum TaxID=2562239 RepID=A0AA36N047_9DINO|nr:unnamed protein product [Effrenium voratum]
MWGARSGWGVRGAQPGQSFTCGRGGRCTLDVAGRGLSALDRAKIVNFSTDCTGEPQEAGFFKSLLIADPAPATSSTSARFSLGQVTAGGVFKVCYCASLDACNSLEAFNHQAGQLEVLDPLSDLSLFSSTVASITVQVQSRLQGMASRIRCAISEYEPSFMPNGADIANGLSPIGLGQGEATEDTVDGANYVEMHFKTFVNPSQQYRVWCVESSAQSFILPQTPGGVLITTPADLQAPRLRVFPSFLWPQASFYAELYNVYAEAVSARRLAFTEVKARPNVRKTKPLVVGDLTLKIRSNGLRHRQNYLEHLAEYGYAVVPQVLGAQELQVAEDLLWDFLHAEAAWQRRAPDTWTDDSLARLGQPWRGIINGRGVGQCDLSWFIRTRAKVQQAFAGIWGTDELITSFDGINVFRPWHAGFSKTEGGWFHVDQGATQQGRCCVQGLVSLYDQNERTGGLVVKPKSHLRHQELCELSKGGEDFIGVPEDHPLLELPETLVSCRAGDLVLWDSRCLHCNTPASDMPDRPRDELLRACVYVCMTPKAWCPEKALEQRRKGYELRVTTSHWPHRHVMGFGWAKAGRLCLEEAPLERRRLIG